MNAYPDNVTPLYRPVQVYNRDTAPAPTYADGFDAGRYQGRCEGVVAAVGVLCVVLVLVGVLRAVLP